MKWKIWLAISIKETELVIKFFPWEHFRPDNFTGEVYQTFKENLTQIPISQKMEEEGPSKSVLLKSE